MEMREYLSDKYAAIMKHLAAVKEEMEKDILDIFQQVLVLTVGGMLAGQAYSLTQADLSPFMGVFLYFMLLTFGLFTLGVVHFIISHTRVLLRE